MNSAVPGSSPTTTELTLRPATADDGSLLFTIFCDVRGAMFAGLPEPQKDILLRMQFHAQKSGYEQGYPDAERMIVVADGRSIGTVMVQRSSVLWRLVDISLLAPYRNRGIGTRLIRDLLDHAAASARSLQLQVARDNPAARLYERLGMQKVAEDDAYVNLQGSSPMHQGQGPNLSQRVIGETGGQQFVALQETEMPAHNHGFQGVSAAGGLSVPTNNVFGAVAFGRPAAYAPSGPANVQMSPSALAPAGGGLPHNNMPPYLCISFIIALQGIFPSRG